MSFTLINPINDSDIAEMESYDLEAAKNIFIPGLTFSIIPHQVKIRCTGKVWLARVPGVFLSRCLLVDQGPVEDGVINTIVFNMGNERQRIEQGDVISRLIAL